MVASTLQMDYERWTQIDRHNHELLTRMDKIMLSRGRVDHINDYKAKPWLVCGCTNMDLTCVCMRACLLAALLSYNNIN